MDAVSLQCLALKIPHPLRSRSRAVGSTQMIHWPVLSPEYVMVPVSGSPQLREDRVTLTLLPFCLQPQLLCEVSAVRAVTTAT